ncbi:MAG: ammonia-forming cytochrome c nitrite reductase subunit c552 [Bacteriovoracaceae bacterium]
MENNKKTIITFFISFLATIGVIGLLVNIYEKKQEAKDSFFKVVKIKATDEDPSIWGQNFPLQYEDYLKSVDQVRTRYGGSEAVPRTPTKADPRSVVSQSKLEEDERLKTIWAGYAFSKDFREDRGHAFMLEDQKYTKRQNVPQPGTCLHCHASTVLPMLKLGKGDLEKGFHKMGTLPYHQVSKLAKHPVACIDCHNSKTMKLRVTRPAFTRSYQKFIGDKNYNPNTMASRQQMKTFVCAQCHVEYYFKGKDKELVYPWENGLKADEILSYYEKNKIKDWVHTDTKASLLKAQHPEFELWSQGIHAKSGVSCTDCHMPYKKVGAHKITDHHIKSPVLNIRRACQTCHNIDEDQLVERVEEIQSRHIEIRDMALDAIVELIDDLKNYPNKNDNSYKKAITYQRKAQFLLDFVEAENSSGFHAPQEAARILALSLDLTRKGQRELVQ